MVFIPFGCGFFEATKAVGGVPGSDPERWYRKMALNMDGTPFPFVSGEIRIRRLGSPFSQAELLLVAFTRLSAE